MDNKFLVCVRCFTFNHAPYIEDTMNGFTMQQTTFPFVCVIVDDASTDGEPEVIKKYLQEHFDLEDKSIVRHEETNDYLMNFAQHKTNRNCFFAVYYLKYNHYRIKKTKIPYITEWNNNKYIALCEGDDYWIAPDKLQKQVDYLEKRNDYTMVCNRTLQYSVRREKFIGEDYCYKKDRQVTADDIINRNGLFIPTCSIVYKKWVVDEYPDYCKNCGVGDYPLQIMCAMKGKVFYFNNIMSVYRVENSTSWTGRQQSRTFSDSRMKDFSSRVQMFKGFSKDYPNYEHVFRNKIAQYINSCMPNWRHSVNEKKRYLDYFVDEIEMYSFRWKIDLFLKKVKIPKVYDWYSKIFLRKYSRPRLKY